ncbi:MAG: hypothetical protein AB7Q00_03720 [Phycisphaerales bacterium]|nr:MAG: hypothetical protein IPK69_08340 [Phycisphaerales bacterium]
MKMTIFDATWKIDAAAFAFAGVLAGVVYIFTLQPRLSASAAESEWRSRLTETISEAESKEASTRQTVGEVQRLRRVTAEVSVELQSTSDLNSHIAAVSTIAQEHHVQINEIRSSPPVPVPGRRHVVVPIDLGGVGAFPDVVSLVALLHEKHRDTSVATFTIEHVVVDGVDLAAFRLGLNWHAMNDAGRTPAPASPGT